MAFKGSGVRSPSAPPYILRGYGIYCSPLYLLVCQFCANTMLLSISNQCHLRTWWVCNLGTINFASSPNSRDKTSSNDHSWLVIPFHASPSTPSSVSGLLRLRKTFVRLGIFLYKSTYKLWPTKAITGPPSLTSKFITASVINFIHRYFFIWFCSSHIRTYSA